MSTVAKPEVLAVLVERLSRLRPESERRWGSLTPAEVLCHLADACQSVLDRPGGEPGPRKRIFKWVALYSPMPWPKGAKTLAKVDPRQDGTRPGDFAADRERAITLLRAIAAGNETTLPRSHFNFGFMTVPDWHRWAFCHTDHHLRQFGL